MDLTRPVMFRTVDLNDAIPGLGATGITGRSVEYCDPSGVAVDQYMDKKSQTDGMDFQGVGNLSMGARSFQMRGMLYANTRTDLWTELAALQTLLDPVQCYAEDQSSEGFLPLAFTAPIGALGLTSSRYVFARPNGLRWATNRDSHGTGAKVVGKEDLVPLAIQWTCDWVSRDPRVYGSLHTVNLTGSASGSWVNAGDYPSLLNIWLVATGTGAGTVRFQLAGQSDGEPWAYDFTIGVPAGGAGRTVFYRGWTKYLTVLDPDIHATDEIFRRDMLTFATPNSDVQHPLILPEANTYTVTVSGVALGAGSKMEFTDAYA